MGEIADGLINGDFDFYTGEYLGRGWGFPRSHQFKKRHSVNPKYGVTHYLNLQGVTDKKEQMNIIKKFFPENTDNQTKNALCIKISDQFGKFITHVKNYLACQTPNNTTSINS